MLVFVYRILPPHVVCPGGNTSWEKVELKEGNRLCEGQKNMCNQTGQPCKSSVFHCFF